LAPNDFKLEEEKLDIDDDAVQLVNVLLEME
jgi:hypothetical protein